MNSKYAIALLLATLPCLALGQDSGSYKCSMGDLQRRVEILSEPGMTVPCEVHYYKDSEAPDEKQVLWNATLQEGYCESKTEEFVAKLESWGWDCGGGAVSMPSPESATEQDAMDEAVDDTANVLPVQDDTDDLKPAMPSD